MELYAYPILWQTEITTPENVNVRIVNIGGKLLRMSYDIENRRRLRQGLPPALTRIVHQVKLIENGVAIHTVEVL
jgi:hypothetical protein